jgi:hypothetical protein
MTGRFLICLLTVVCLITGCDSGSNSIEQYEFNSAEAQTETLVYKKIIPEETKVMIDDEDEYILLRCTR